MAIPVVLRAFGSRNYRLYFSGQLVSLLGSWMGQTAVLWLAYHLTDSPFMLGLTGFVTQAPSLFLVPIAGVWVDRLNRHKLLITTQVLSMLQSFALAYFVLTDSMTIGHLLVLGAFQGVLNAFDLPVRQALVIEFVEKRENLSNAIALNSSMFNLARLVGPALAGFVIAAYGTGVCFLIDGTSYAAVIGSLLAMKIAPQEKKAERRGALTEFKEGWNYVIGFVPIRVLMGLVMVISFAGFSFSVLAPVFARDVFHGDAKTLGSLMGASGFGSLLAALYLGTRQSVRGLGNVIVGGGGLLGMGLIGFSMARTLPLAMACLVAVGLGGVLMMASSNTVVQTLVDNDKRGRVMSFFTLAFMGTVPIGNLAMGSLGKWIGVSNALLAGGAICLLAAGAFYFLLPGIRAAAAPAMARSEGSVPDGGG